MSTYKVKNHISTATRVISYLLSAIQIIVAVILDVLLIKSNLLPTQFQVIIITILILFILLTLWLALYRTSNKKLISATVISLIVSIICATGIYYLNHGLNTAKSITDAKTETSEYGVYVLKSDKAETIQDCKDYNFGIVEIIDRENTDKVLKLIENDTNITPKTTASEDMFVMSKSLLNSDVQAVVLKKAYIDSILEGEGFEDFTDKIKEIKSYNLTTEVPTPVNPVNDTSFDKEKIFTVYISGIDVNGPISTTSRSDVNILAVVNSNTHQILLLSTPRDFYVPLSISHGVKDKLTHAGIYGIDTSVNTLSMLYDTNVDYYVRVNFSGFMKVIDSLGSVTVNSDYDFKVGNYSYSKGLNTLNAEQALAFARERHSFASGDRQRGKNQMALIKGVINKVASPAILKNYTELMNGLESSIQTSMPYTTISNLVKDQLSNNGSWNIQQYSVNGTGEMNRTYSMPSQSLYVMVPDQATVNQAKEYIKQIQNGETPSIAE